MKDPYEGLIKYTFECPKGHSFSLGAETELDRMPPGCLVCFDPNIKQVEGPTITS
jgi:hypothetical protein